MFRRFVLVFMFAFAMMAALPAATSAGGCTTVNGYESCERGGGNEGYGGYNYSLTFPNGAGFSGTGGGAGDGSVGAARLCTWDASGEKVCDVTVYSPRGK